jgi:hypothetical protein
VRCPPSGRHRKATPGSLGDDVAMTMPDPDNAGSDREAAPLGAEVAPPADPESQGGGPGPASGIAGPSYPPAETEPDAH